MPERIRAGRTYVLTKDYRTGPFGPVLKAGTGLLVTQIYKGFTGEFVDVRLKDGSFVRKIPAKYFAV